MSPLSSWESESTRALFDEVSATYGLANVTSFGFCLRWRNQTIRVLGLMSHAGELSRGMTSRAGMSFPFAAVVHFFGCATGRSGNNCA